MVPISEMLKSSRTLTTRDEKGSRAGNDASCMLQSL